MALIEGAQVTNFRFLEISLSPKLNPLFVIDRFDRRLITVSR